MELERVPSKEGSTEITRGERRGWRGAPIGPLYVFFWINVYLGLPLIFDWVICLFACF